MKLNTLYNMNCMDFMKTLDDNCVTLTLTDIPYDGVNRKDNGLRNLDKGDADIITFNLLQFLNEVFRITSGTIIIFCGQGQLSEIFKFFSSRAGTTRQLIWEKTNPSPMNGEYTYLSGVENAIWFKKHGATFNARCKNCVFKFPNGSSKVHPTEKNHLLLEQLILDNSNDFDTVFDPCAGSGSHLYVAKKTHRNYLGCELNTDWFNIAQKRLQETVTYNLF